MPAAAALKTFRRVAAIGKLRSPEIDATLRQVKAFLAQRKCELVAEGAQADLAIVVGGDGSLLAAARGLGGRRGAVVGINLGPVGFITDIGGENKLDNLG